MRMPTSLECDLTALRVKGWDVCLMELSFPHICVLQARPAGACEDCQGTERILAEPSSAPEGEDCRHEERAPGNRSVSWSTCTCTYKMIALTVHVCVQWCKVYCLESSGAACTTCTQCTFIICQHAVSLFTRRKKKGLIS